MMQLTLGTLRTAERVQILKL